MSWLRIRAYNVLQGDAFLITIPDRDAHGVEHERHILVDVGNLNRDTPYEKIIKDILSVTKNKKVDLYVMTHEHMDHIEGLYYAKKNLNLEVKAEYAWLTASADPEYYQNHPDAKRAFELAKKSLEEIAHFLAATGEELPQSRATLEMNSFMATEDCVKYLRKIAPKSRTFYVHKDLDIKGKHPFEEVELNILAPEEDTSTYYIGIQSIALGVTDGSKRKKEYRLAPLYPPAGVDAGAFYRLVESRRNSYADGLLSIDKAKNNTSVVFTIKWRGWLLLFVGDAQTKSWQKMYDDKLLEPVHFLKVGHHGSHNATPKKKEILSKILPKTSATDIPWAVVPVGPNSFGHPHKVTLKRLKGRCDFDSTEDLDEGSYIDYEFPG